MFTAIPASKFDAPACPLTSLTRRRALRPQELEETTKFTDAAAYLPDTTATRRGSNRRTGDRGKGWLAWCCYRQRSRSKDGGGRGETRGDSNKAAGGGE